LRPRAGPQGLHHVPLQPRRLPGRAGQGEGPGKHPVPLRAGGRLDGGGQGQPGNRIRRRGALGRQPLRRTQRGLLRQVLTWPHGPGKRAGAWGTAPVPDCLQAAARAVPGARRGRFHCGTAPGTTNVPMTTHAASPQEGPMSNGNGNGVTATLSEAAETARETISGIGSGIAATASEAVSTASEAVTRVRKAATRRATTAKKTAAKKVAKARKAVKTDVARAKEWVKKDVSKAKKKLTEAKDNSNAIAAPLRRKRGKPAPKKATAKKATAKKATARKAAAKKAVARKAPAKKTATRKAVAKKAVAKKAVARKAPAKKTVAKK